MTNQLLWDDLESTNTAQLEEQRQKKYEEDHHFHKAFNTPSGKLVLEWLVKYTLDCPTWMPQVDYDKSVANGFFREGQNSLVRQIISKIEFAKNYKETQK